MFGLGKKKFQAISPCPGEVVTVDQVPDPVFSQKLLGDGFAVQPPEDAASFEVCAPVDGTLANIFATGHAFAMVSDKGIEVLVHIGLETVGLKGEGFEILAANSQKVKAGTPVVRVDAASVRTAGCKLITPVVFTKADQLTDLEVHTGQVSPGQVACQAKYA